jgi:RND family efflux transporter MFP subunit
VSVPQPDAAQITPGLAATLEFTDHPGTPYTAAVASTAHALDATTRTLQVELQLDNPQGELLPGSYVQVTFKLPASTGTLRVPVNAVLFRAEGMLVASVDAQRHVHLKNISPGRDFGTEIEVLSGVSPADTLIVNPPDSLTDGAEVRLQPPAPPHGGKGAEPS